jgi:hypothetical protein
MRRKSIVFVLGAGASAGVGVGYPIGLDLKRNSCLHIVLASFYGDPEGTDSRSNHRKILIPHGTSVRIPATVFAHLGNPGKREVNAGPEIGAFLGAASY